MEILGVRIDNFSKKEILEKIEFFLNEERFRQIATVNPEFILHAQKDENFKDLLNGCDLNVADGVGIWYAFIRNFNFLKKRFAGVDLVNEILEIANRKKMHVYLAINRDGLSKYLEIKKSLNKKYANLKISGKNMNQKDSYKYKILDAKYDILLCNFGSRHQEKFLNSQKNGSMKLAMGIGGSFDILTGKVKRAPKLMRILGLEWLWRLIAHPSSDKVFYKKRLKRIFNSVIVFPLRVLINK